MRQLSPPQVLSTFAVLCFFGSASAQPADAAVDLVVPQAIQDYCDPTFPFNAPRVC